MKSFFTSIAIFTFFTIQAQEYSVKIFPNRYRMSWEKVSMTEEPDLGFVGIGFDLFNLNSKYSSIYFGLNSYSALEGIRPGLITLGISAGWYKKIFEKNIFIDIGAFVGGGGGGGADDGGGLIIRPHIALEKRFGKIGVSLGFSRIDFPSGSISGNQVNFGISLNSSNYFNIEKSNFYTLKNTSSMFSNLRFAFVGTQYYNFIKGSNTSRPDVENGKVSLLGIQLEKPINPNLYGIFKINGAFKGGADGYMSIFLGAGGKLPILKNRLNIEGRLLFGPSGGGGIKSGGGSTAQTELGISTIFKNGYDLKLMAGRTFAPWGDFGANHIEIGIGKTVGVFSASDLSKKINKFNVSAKEYKINKLAVSIFNRTYFPPKKPRKDGEIYQSYFNLLCFEFQKYIGERFSINGGTTWAYQGDYGAYAEGLLGATYYHPISHLWKVTFRGMLGAGGGGLIDLGSGLLFQYSAGIEKRINKKLDFFINAGKVQPLKGNFNPYSLDVGVRFHIHQLLKI